MLNALQFHFLLFVIRIGRYMRLNVLNNLNIVLISNCIDQCIYLVSCKIVINFHEHFYSYFRFSLKSMYQF